jgi:hypothetical protein
LFKEPNPIFAGQARKRAGPEKPEKLKLRYK